MIGIVLRWSRLSRQPILRVCQVEPSTAQRKSFCTPPFFKAQTAPNPSMKPRKNPRPLTSAQKIRQRISTYLREYASPEVQAKLAPFREAVKEQGEVVRNLKESSNASKSEIESAVAELKSRKRRLEEAESELAPKEAAFDRTKLEDLLKRRFFYDQSFSIYGGGVTGLIDFGPMGCALKNNLIQEWRKHFILEENMLELDCTALTPEAVLRASGHLERFADWMVRDTGTGECFRADHLIRTCIEDLLEGKKTSETKKSELRGVLSRLEEFDDNDIREVITKYDFKSPLTGNELSEPIAFNLMFSTQIGPTADFKAYLRPETAQGIFVNFKRLLEFNQGKLPFAAAQIGSGFRNEISPKHGLIRVREFTMCEIEYFVDPTDKRHPKFKRVADYPLPLFSARDQTDGTPAKEITVGEAVKQGIIENETLGYYMARCAMYLLKVGVDSRRLRFRQHLSSEMAHYAQDCWDAEVLTSCGWVECVGHADRACYDLLHHSKASGHMLAAKKGLSEPRRIETFEAQPIMSILGKEFRQDAKKIQAALAELGPEQVAHVEKQLNENKVYKLQINDEQFALTDEMLTVKRTTKMVNFEEIVPGVIEPAYGIGRVMYAVLEHAFREREGDEQRNFLVLPPLVAPLKCSVLPITSHERFAPLIQAVAQQLVEKELTYRVEDSSTSIGRRYTRTDEIGIPYGITIDFDSLSQPPTVTLRHAETAQQIRVELSEVGAIVEALVKGRLTWAEVTSKYPLFEWKDKKSQAENSNND